MTAANSSEETGPWLLAIVATSLLVAVPFVDFLAANPSALGAAGRVLKYYGYALGCVMAWGLIVGLMCRALGMFAWRGVLAAAVHGFMFFQFHEVQRLLPARMAEAGRSVFWIWLALTLLLSLLTWLAVRTRQRLLAVVAIAAVLLAIPARQVIAQLATRSRSLGVERTRLDGRALIRPNVYWIVLDGYPRADVLRRDFAFDNTAFLEGLTRRGYVVQSRATSNYPTSLESIANTVDMNYRLAEDPLAREAPAVLDLFSMVRGQNATVAEFRRFGYRYVHYANGYDNMTVCSNEPDVCVIGSRGLDEVDVSLLSRTPYMDASLPRGPLKAADEQAFVRGSVADLDAKLSAIQETQNPFFVYAHVLLPHPPLRFDSECRERPSRPDLRTWDPANRQNFIEQLACTNRQASDLLDHLARTDPNALIVVQADHGSAFREPFARAPDQWTPDQVDERFAILSAMKLPSSCGGANVPDALSSVNTFRVVFSCLTGTRSELLPTRLFVPPYEPYGRAYQRTVVEYIGRNGDRKYLRRVEAVAVGAWFATTEIGRAVEKQTLENVKAVGREIQKSATTPVISDRLLAEFKRAMGEDLRVSRYPEGFVVDLPAVPRRICELLLMQAHEVPGAVRASVTSLAAMERDVPIAPAQAEADCAGQPEPVYVRIIIRD